MDRTLSLANRLHCCWLVLVASLLALLAPSAAAIVTSGFASIDTLTTEQMNQLRASYPEQCFMAHAVAATVCEGELAESCGIWPFCVTCRDGCTAVPVSQQSGMGVHSFGYPKNTHCGRLFSTYRVLECTDLCFCEGEVISTNFCTSVNVVVWKSCVEP